MRHSIEFRDERGNSENDQILEPCVGPVIHRSAALSLYLRLDGHELNYTTSSFISTVTDDELLQENAVCGAVSDVWDQTK